MSGKLNSSPALPGRRVPCLKSVHALGPIASGCGLSATVRHRQRLARETTESVSMLDRQKRSHALKDKLVPRIVSVKPMVVGAPPIPACVFRRHRLALELVERSSVLDRQKRSRALPGRSVRRRCLMPVKPTGLGDRLPAVVRCRQRARAASVVLKIVLPHRLHSVRVEQVVGPSAAGFATGGGYSATAIIFRPSTGSVCRDKRVAHSSLLLA